MHEVEREHLLSDARCSKAVQSVLGTDSPFTSESRHDAAHSDNDTKVVPNSLRCEQAAPLGAHAMTFENPIKPFVSKPPMPPVKRSTVHDDERRHSLSEPLIAKDTQLLSASHKAAQAWTPPLSTVVPSS